MARISRMGLDMALVSIRTASPLVAKLWCRTKNALCNTKARTLVESPVLEKVENFLGAGTQFAINKMQQMKNFLLPHEEKYLIKQLEVVKKKIKDPNDDTATAKTVKPAIGSAWQYAKTEIAPPMTLSLLHGPYGKAFENKADLIGNKVIQFLEAQIKSIELAEKRKIEEQNAKLKAAEELARKLVEDAKKKAAEEAAKAKKAAEAKAAEKKKEDEAKKGKPDGKGEKSETKTTKPDKKPRSASKKSAGKKLRKSCKMSKKSGGRKKSDTKKKPKSKKDPPKKHNKKPC